MRTAAFANPGLPSDAWAKLCEEVDLARRSLYNGKGKGTVHSQAKERLENAKFARELAAAQRNKEEVISSLSEHIAVEAAKIQDEVSRLRTTLGGKAFPLSEDHLTEEDEIHQNKIAAQLLSNRNRELRAILARKKQDVKMARSKDKAGRSKQRAQVCPTSAKPAKLLSRASASLSGAAVVKVTKRRAVATNQLKDFFVEKSGHDKQKDTRDGQEVEKEDVEEAEERLGSTEVDENVSPALKKQATEARPKWLSLAESVEAVARKRHLNYQMHCQTQHMKI